MRCLINLFGRTRHQNLYPICHTSRQDRFKNKKKKKIKVQLLYFYLKSVFIMYLILFCPAAGHRMWALQRLRKLLTTEYGQSININRLLGDSEGEARSVVSKHLNVYIKYL